ncbi:MAG TPA: hypothetical protein VM510_03000 [Caulifigura sp.]|nr:hypothetical protein [Caulifigura sp.]
MSTTVRPFNSWVTGQTTTHAAIGAVGYNSGLSTVNATATTNAVMTIYLRLVMIQVSSKETVLDANNASVAHQDWKLDEFVAFHDVVKQQAEDFWNDNTFTLIPPSSYRGLNWPPGNRPTHRLNINCRFQVVWAGGPSDAHRVIRATRLTKEDADSKAARSHWELYDSGDTRPAIFNNHTNCGRPVVIEHLTVPHEIGHAIGLPHVGTFHDLTRSEYQCKEGGIDPASTTDWNKGGKDPYGNFSTEEEMRNIMGYGQGKAMWNFLPWILRIPAHTFSETMLADWKFSMANVAPKPL